MTKRWSFVVWLLFLCLSTDLHAVGAMKQVKEQSDLLAFAYDAMQLASEFTEKNPDVVEALAQCFAKIDDHATLNVTSPNLVREVLRHLRGTQITGNSTSTSTNNNCDMVLVTSLLKYSADVGSHLSTLLQNNNNKTTANQSQLAKLPPGSARISQLLASLKPSPDLASLSSLVRSLINVPLEESGSGKDVLLVHGHHVGGGGTRPNIVWMGMSFSQRLYVVLPLAIIGFTLVCMSWLVGKVRKPRPNEMRVEKMRRVFGTFDHFWQAVVSLESSERTQWVQALCITADDVDGTLVGDIIHPHEHAESGQSDLPPAEPSLLSQRIKQAVAVEDKTNELAGNSKELPRTPTTATTPAQSTTGSDLVLLEVSKTELVTIFTDPDADILKVRAEQCWDSLKEEVINARDVRSWRMMVKRSFRALALLLSISGLLVYFVAIMGPGTVLCDRHFLEQQDVQTLHDCQTESQYELCRCECAVNASASTFGYYLCFTPEGSAGSQGKDSEWVALVQCPNVRSLGPDSTPPVETQLVAPDVFFG